MDRPLSGAPAFPDAALTADASRAAEMHRAAIREYRDALEQEISLPQPERVSIRLSLTDSLIACGRFREAHEAVVVLEPLVREPCELDDLGRARILSRLGWTDFFAGKLGSCVACCESASELLRPSVHHDDLAQVLRWLGFAQKWKGEIRQARESFRDALAAAKRGSDRSQLALCLDAMGAFHHFQGEYEEATCLYSEAHTLSEELGSRYQFGKSSFGVALSSLYCGEWTHCEHRLEESVRAFVDVSHNQGVVVVHLTLARLHARRGQPERSRACAQRAHALAEEAGFLRACILAEEHFGDLAMEASDLQTARAHYETALQEARSSAPQGDLVYEVAWRLARLHVALGNLNEARQLADEAVQMADAASDRREHANALVTKSMVSSALGDPEAAHTLIEQALDEFRRIRTPFELAEAHELAAELEAQPAGTLARTPLSHLVEAHRLYAMLGLRDRCARLEARIGISTGQPPDATPSDAAVRLLTESPLLLELVATAEALASDDSTVLIEGETGTGKELLAHIVHEAGARAEEPFVAVNCAALAELLLESELFGHRKGAFTGAERDHTGVLQSAGKGTVLLDEIDKASLPFQEKLLRVLEERQIHPVGSSRLVPLEARVLCASNRALKELSDRGAFLPDLYFRLAAFRLSLPALRDRIEDIPLLSRHFLRENAGRFGADRYDISDEALAALVAYEWPGNVRELKNVIVAAAFYARETGAIRLSHLPQEVRHRRNRHDPSLQGRIADLERREIEAAMKKAGGVKTEAARLLGVSRKGLRERLRRLGLE